MIRPGVMVAGVLALAVLHGCTNSDPLSGRSWQATNLGDGDTASGVVSQSYTIAFVTNGTANTFTATLVREYSGSAALFPSCMQMSTITGTWSDDLANQNEETWSASNLSATTSRTTCANSSDDQPTALADPALAMQLSGGSTTFTVNGLTMTAYGDSALPNITSMAHAYVFVLI